MNKFDEWKKRKAEIEQLHLQGKTQVEIGRLFGITRQRVQQVLTHNAQYKRWLGELSPEKRHELWLKRKEKSIAYNREWRKRNRKKVSGYSRKWEKKHPEKVLEMRKRSYYRHKKERLAQQHKRYMENEEARTYKKEWNKQRYIINNLTYSQFSA